MIIKALIVSAILGACFLLFGIGVLFLGKKAKQNACGTPPKETNLNAKNTTKVKTDNNKKFECPSQKAGLRAQEDKSGGLDMANNNRLYEIE